MEPIVYDAEFGHALQYLNSIYPPDTLFISQRFNRKEEVKDFINCFHIQNHCTYNIQFSNQSRFVV